MANSGYCFRSILFLVLFLSACGKQEEASDLDFQTNTPQEFVLTDVFKGEGALEEAWDSADGKVVNQHLNEMITGYSDPFETVSFASGDLLKHESQPVANFLGSETRKAVNRLIEPKECYKKKSRVDGFHKKSGESYMIGFYSVLDRLSENESQPTGKYATEVLHKIISYYILPENNLPSEIRDDMQELMDDITGDDFHGDFTDLTKGVAKLLIRSDYSLWVDLNDLPQNYDRIDTISDTDLQLGNVVQGVNSLMMGLNGFMTDEASRGAIHTLIREVAGLFNPAPGSNNADRVRDLICNLESQFIKGGAQFMSNPVYNTDNSEIFSGGELHEWTRDILPPMIQYLMRGDRSNSLISDTTGQKAYPVDILVQNLKSMEWDIENARIEESMYDMLRFDLRGRDRVSDPDASHLSFLENLIFFSALGANFGFTDGETTGEISSSSNPNYTHGHGEGAGKLTLNDVLYSMETSKTDILPGLLGVGMYDIAFSDDNKDNIFRSPAPFNVSNRNSYKFNYDQDYSVALFLSGTPGDMGSPLSGANPLDGSGNPILNAYRPYCPTGVMEDNVALNTMSASMRAAWRAEGPYYYAPEKPPTITIDGKAWEIFYTPAGKIYAYVLKSTADPATWQYTYPAQFEGQAMEDTAFAILRPKMTHTAFTSSVDLTGGVRHSLTIPSPELRITIGETGSRFVDTTIVLPRYPDYCSRETLITRINDAVGEDVCFEFDSDGKELVQIVSTRGPITISNQTRNPLGTFLVSGADSDDSVSEQINTFKVTGNAVVNIQLDDETGQTVTFGANENGGYWTVEAILNKLTASPVGNNVLSYGKYIKLFGNTSDSETARVLITNSPESEINAIEAFFGVNGESLNAYLMRIERYKDIFHTDYYMIQRGGDYKTITTDKNGNHQIVSVGSGEEAQFVVVEETIPETEPMRPCASYEEAIFRNYQFFFAERKFVLILPLRLAMIGMEMASVFQIMESNGYTGFMYARKFRGNHEWAKKGSSGKSLVPGDYRLEICADVSGLAGILMSTESIYNDTLGCGTSFGAILPHNAATIYRLGFPRAPKINHGKDDFGTDIIDYQVGSRDFEVGDAIWNKRNALLILLQALWGGLHENTEPGYASIKGGMLPFFEMTTATLQPLFYFQKDQGEYPRNCWKPRLLDDREALISSSTFYDSIDMDTWYGSDYEREYYRAAKVKTIITPLIDSDPYGEKGAVKRCDGVLPMITEYNTVEDSEPETRLITALLKTLIKTRETAFDDPADTDYNAEDFDAGWESWGARRKLYYGIEQIISGIRFTKGRYTSLNESDSYKNSDYPNWMFATGVDASKDAFGNYTEYKNVRDTDLILDWGIDKLVGQNTVDESNEGYGLAHYPDDKTTDADWKDFYDTMDLLEGILHNESDYSVTEPLIDLLDNVLAGPIPYTPDEISGMIYALGKLFAYYDTDRQRWYYQGYDPDGNDPDVDFKEIYTIMAQHLPAIHDILKDDTGQNYYASLVLLKELSKPGGMLEFLSGSVCTSSDWETILKDLESFLGRDIVTNDDPMWSSIATLLEDLAQAADNAQDGTLLNDIYESYGFQVN